MARHSVNALVAGIAALLPSLATAQAWSVQSGVAARVEYNDNYFFAPANHRPSLRWSLRS